jgi:hypothetical protein
MFYRRLDQDYSELGQAVRLKAKELLHEKHLSGQFDPSLEDALREASRILCADLVKTVKKIQEGKNGNGKTVSEIDERVAEKREKRAERGGASRRGKAGIRDESAALARNDNDAGAKKKHEGFQH